MSNRCTICFHAHSTTLHTYIAPIPHNIIKIHIAFSRFCTNFCSPVMVKSGIRRIKAIKNYISVFVCFSTRAERLELVLRLTSDVFLTALVRFIARRGHLRSDNWTYFVEANQEFHKYFKTPNLEIINDLILGEC